MGAEVVRLIFCVVFDASPCAYAGIIWINLVDFLSFMCFLFG